MTTHTEQISELEDRLIVELGYKRVEQFFYPANLSIISQRDLSDDAEKALIYSIIDRESRKPVEYVVRFPAPEVTSEVETGLPEAVKTYFTYRCQGARRDLRILLKRIKYGRIIGLIILAVLVVIGFYLFSLHVDDIFGGTIIIFCWVVLWDPIDLFHHQYLIQKGIIRIELKRIIHGTVRVEPAPVRLDGMPEHSKNL